MTAPRLRVVEVPTAERSDLLTVAVVESARALVAALLLEERELLRDPEGVAYALRVANIGDALQTCRDACAAERAARGAQAITCTRCGAKNWDPHAAQVHARWCDGVRR